MAFKRVFLKIFDFIKKHYFKLFHFMLGKDERKFSRLGVHMITIMLLFMFLPFHISTLIGIIGQHFTGYAMFNFIDFLVAAIMPVVLASLFVLGVKLMVYISAKIGF